MRYRSIAAPLVLILLGGLFLLHNMRPEFPIAELISNGWPFLLIGFGLIRLLEILIDAGRGKPLPVRAFGGGSVAALILLCLVMWGFTRHSSAFRMGRFSSGGLALFGEQFDYPVSLQQSASGASKLIIDNLRGSVTVTGGEGGLAAVDGRKLVRAYNRCQADEANRRSPIEMVREGDQLILRSTGNTSGRGADSVSMDIEIKVPRSIGVEARNRSGDLSVQTIDGLVDVSNDRGDVRLSAIGGDAKIEALHSGVIRVIDLKGALDLQGRGSDVQLENIAGQVSINGSYSGTLEFRNLAKPMHFESPQTDLRVEELPGNISMDLGSFRAMNLTGMRLITKSRDVQVEGFSDALEIEVERGDVDIKPEKTPLSKIDVHVRHGNVDLALPETAVFDLRATTVQGEARNDFGPAVTMENEGRSASLKSAAGKGPAITVTTDRGTVSVRKS